MPDQSRIFDHGAIMSEGARNDSMCTFGLINLTLIIWFHHGADS
jgi:hypothetical protein